MEGVRVPQNILLTKAFARSLSIKGNSIPSLEKCPFLANSLSRLPCGYLFGPTLNFPSPSGLPLYQNSLNLPSE